MNHLSLPSPVASLKLDSPLVRCVVARWRELTGGPSVQDTERRSLIACSGGPDSVCLALLLGSRGLPILLGHVIHDFRDQTQTHAERDLVEQLANRLGVPCVCRSIQVRAMAGNDEANARAARYQALESMAHQNGCPFVLTAHHANDQLETHIMALMRGSGLAGLAAIAPRRPLGSQGIELIRPMLEMSHDDCLSVCQQADQPYALDPTNADTSRMRAAVRRFIVPHIQSLRPNSLEAVVRSLDHLRQAHEVIDQSIQDLLAKALQTPSPPAPPTALVWQRRDLQQVHSLIASGALRRAFITLHAGAKADALSASAVGQAMALIVDDASTTKHLDWPGVELIVQPDIVTVSLFQSNRRQHP